jgi:hypothetical protein
MKATVCIPPLQGKTTLQILADGRISIHAGDPTQATRIAQRFQALGNHVRQYGSRLIIHADGQ